MTDLSPVPIEDRPDALLFVFRDRGPLPAAEVGRLLTALARDYKRATGRTLAATNIRTGSTWIQVMDMASSVAPLLGNAADIAKGVGSLADFGKLIFGTMQRKRAGVSSDNEAKASPGDLATDAILDAAIRSGAEVDLRQQSPDGSVTELKITPVEAVRIREREKTRRVVSKTQQASLPPPELRPLLQSPDAADSIRRLAYSGASEDLVRNAIRDLAATLRRLGLERVIEDVALDFERAGEPELARLLRAEK